MGKTSGSLAAFKFKFKLSFIVIPLHVGTYSGTKCRASQDHGATYINVYPIQLKIKIKNTNYENASHKYCTCAERNIVSQAAGWGTV